MLERKKIKDLNDYFLKLEERKEKGVYCKFCSNGTPIPKSAVHSF